MAAINLTELQSRKGRGEKFACLTAYDAIFAEVVSQQGVEVILVGDSLGMVLQGKETTLPVTVEQMAYHTECVARGNQGALIMVDMPFMANATLDRALASAATLMQAGGQIIKLEGGAWLQEQVTQLSHMGVPTCVHLGLTPQSVHKFGGYRVQGKADEAADKMVEEALAVEAAGAAMLLLECVPRPLATRITQTVSVPVIGIGAGPECDAQVLVLHDMLNVSAGKKPKFVKNFMAEASSIAEAINHYGQAVRGGTFPAEEHCFSR